jgi:hypothetical protein
MERMFGEFNDWEPFGKLNIDERMINIYYGSE